jgi:hypothetical protein
VRPAARSHYTANLWFHEIDFNERSVRLVAGTADWPITMPTEPHHTGRIEIGVRPGLARALRSPQQALSDAAAGEVVGRSERAASSVCIRFRRRGDQRRPAALRVRALRPPRAKSALA